MSSRSRMTMTARFVLAFATVIVFLLGVPAQSAFAAPDTAADICRVPIAKADADDARRDAHDARPHLFEIPAQQARSNAYAAEINADLARDREAVRQCDDIGDPTRLTPENQWLVAHAPLNFQWMSRRANTAKNSGYAGRIKNADPKWVEEQDELQRTTRATLLELIATLIAAQ